MAEASLDRALLAEIFERSERLAFSGNLFQFTRDGIWLPMPLDVIEAGLKALRAEGLFEEQNATRLMDAGMGDARLVASLCGLGDRVHALGMETHHSLYRLSLENLRSLPVTNWSVVNASYLDPAAYTKLGVAIDSIDVVFNYPDGNEDALVRFFREHGRKGAHLVFFTPDQSLAFEGVVLHRLLTIERGFRVYVYRI